MTIVVDIRTILHGWHAHSRVDTGVDGLDLPLGRIRHIAGIADIIPILLDENGVVLKMGRTVRLATRAQRRALRAMYRRCAMPGCNRRVGDCEPHHTIEWDQGGHTDIDLLLPVCKHDHDRAHRLGWTLTLGRDRTLTITLPDGTTMTTGPPSEQWE